MKPGLQWASLCPCPSAAVPLLGTDLIRPYLACVPLPIHSMKKLGVLQGPCQGLVTPAHHFPPLPAGKPPRWWQCDRQVCCGRLAPAEQCKPSGGFLPSEAQEGQNLLLFCKLLKDTCYFPGFYFSQACLKLFSEFVRCDWHFHWSAFFKERVKNLVLRRCKSLVTVVLKTEILPKAVQSTRGPEQGC